MADKKSYRWFKLFIIFIAVPSILFLGLAWGSSGSCWAMDGSIWLCLLFGGPVLIQALGLWHLDSKFESNRHLLNVTEEAKAEAKTVAAEAAGNGAKEEIGVLDSVRVDALVVYSTVYLISMGLCLITYSGLWLAFATQIYWRILSFIALGVIGVLLLIVMLMTRAIISYEGPSKAGGQKRHNSYYLKMGAAQAPFLTLLFFLTIFLGVSYLFGFALAFHDKTATQACDYDPNKQCAHPALYSRDLNKFFNPVSDYSPPSPPAPILHNLSFRPGQTSVNVNDPQLGIISDEINRLLMANKSVLVSVTGDAIEAKPKGRKPTSMSVSQSAEARARSAKKSILERLSKNDFNWHGFQLITRSQPDGDSNSVEVKIEQNPEDLTSLRVANLEKKVAAQLEADKFKPLDLMDYIYFANYTITTTGYGDIMPNTVYAKFICSFANICEVFFLVVFFNALLSLSGNKTMDDLVSRIKNIEGRVGRIDENIEKRRIEARERLRGLSTSTRE